MNAAIHQKNRAVIVNIKRIRISKGYSQEYMGLKMNISQNTFSKLELGYMELSISRFLQIAQILDVSSDLLLEATGAFALHPPGQVTAGSQKKAIHRVVAPCPTGLAGLTSLSA